MIKTIQATAVVIFLCSTMAWAQQNPLVGTWKTNPAKSKSILGPPSITQVAKYEASGANGVKYTSDRVSSTGSKSHLEFTANFDGKAYPYKGTGSEAETRDGVTIKKFDAYTYQVSYKKGGETTQINYLIVSKDGKTLSTVSTGVGSNNQVYSRVSVADRQ